MASGDWIDSGGGGGASTACGRTSEYHNRPGHHLSRGRNGGKWNVAGQLARFHNAPESGDSGGKHERTDWRRWICEPEPDAQRQCVAGGELLYGCLSPERRDSEPGVLGRSGIIHSFGCLGAGAAGALHRSGAAGFRGVCAERYFIAERVVSAAGRRSSHRPPHPEQRSSRRQPGGNKALCRSARGGKPAPGRRSADRTADGAAALHQANGGSALRGPMAIEIRQQRRDSNVGGRMRDLHLRLPGNCACALCPDGDAFMVAREFRQLRSATGFCRLFISDSAERLPFRRTLPDDC